jgi:GT2 family glycosyltransferase
MFFKKELLKEIGYPREEFFLYGDDHDFSYRITKAGGAIILVLDSVIHDLEVSFHLDKTASKRHINSRFFKTESRNAIYYSTRNSIVFEQNFVKHPFEYRINRYLYLLALAFAMLLRFQHLWKLPLIMKAIKDSKGLL